MILTKYFWIFKIWATLLITLRIKVYRFIERQFYFNSYNNELCILLSSYVSSILDFEGLLVESQESRWYIAQGFIGFWADFVVVGVSSTTREIFYRFSPSRLLSRAYHEGLSSPHPKSPLISFSSYVRLNIYYNNNNS